MRRSACLVGFERCARLGNAAVRGRARQPAHGFSLSIPASLGEFHRNKIIRKPLVSDSFPCRTLGKPGGCLCR